MVTQPEMDQVKQEFADQEKTLKETGTRSYKKHKGLFDWL